MQGLNSTPDLQKLKQELTEEFGYILHYWKSNTFDDIHGGFVGRIDENENIIPKAEKGGVLNARILWTFSAAFNHAGNQDDLNAANRSYNYIKKHFIDEQYGGVYWSVDHLGNPLDAKKQIYAIAFMIYGLTEYYKTNYSEEVLNLAIALFNDIEDHSFDPEAGGYFEAFTRTWDEIEDIRLSEKDANEKKTMNTHLHVLEAYTNLYRIWPNEVLNQRIRGLITVFTDHIINSNYHLDLFFDENWLVKSKAISYGHDIEASWLLLEAAEVIADHLLIYKIETLAVKIAMAASAGIGKDGGLNYEFNPANFELDDDKHWWVQAEGMVGFFNAWNISKDSFFLEQVFRIWTFTKQYLLDKKNGEWFWGVRADYTLMLKEDKVGLWKCPYHNSRACLELIKRIDVIII